MRMREQQNKVATFENSDGSVQITPWQRFREILKSIENCSPFEQVELVRELKCLAGDIGTMPEQYGVVYFPGLALPANQIIVVENIPPVTPGSTSNAISIKVNQPGLLVGMWGGVRSTTPGPDKTFIDFQIQQDNRMNLVSNTKTPNAFASFAMFADTTNWIPLMWPQSGNSNLQATFRVDASYTGDEIQAMFHFAFLAPTIP